MEYVGPVYYKNITTWAETKLALKWLKNQGYISSANTGPSGIGTTIKMALNISSRKLPGPSGKYYTIKSKRIGSSVRITGFSKTPIWTDGWNPKSILEEFGYSNKAHEKNLRIRITSRPNNQRIYLVFRDGRIYIYGANSKLGFFTEKMLIEGIEKSSSIIFIHAETKKDKNYGEAFNFMNTSLIELNKKLSVKEIFNLVRDGKMSMEFRMFLRDDGTVRDHGFGFRFNTMDIFGEYKLE